MELGHLLTRSVLTYPEVSSKVYHDSLCQLDSSVSLPWVIHFEAFYLHIGGNAIPKHAGPEAKGSNPTAGLTLIWARKPFRRNCLTEGSRTEKYRLIEKYSVIQFSPHGGSTSPVLQ